jgi:6-phosphogluconolactonase (cycloisomerase 2 family)
VHPNGKFLFHIARSGTTTVYKIGDDGALTAGAKAAGGNDGALTRDGKYLLVVSGATVKTFAVDPNTGDLRAAGTGQAANTAQSVTVVEL